MSSQFYGSSTSFSDGKIVTFRFSSGSNTVAGNLVFTAPNIYTYNLKTPITITSDDIEIGVFSIQYTNSTRNVTALLNNNTFSYTMPATAGGPATTYTVTFPDGFYNYGSATTPNDIYGYLKTQMDLNNSWMLDVNGNRVYFIAEQLNAPLYALTFTLSPVSIPAGGSDPNGIASPSGYTPSITIPSTNIQQFFGITAGTYPATNQTVVTYVNSNIIPELNQVSEVSIQAPNLVNNYNVGEGIYDLFSFPIANVPYGDQATPAIYNIEWLPCRQQNFSNFQFVLVDQNDTALQVYDPTLFCLNLIFRQRPKYMH